MIEPNWGLLLWLILGTWIFNSLFGFVVAALSWGETRKYGWGDVVGTLTAIAFVLAVLLTQFPKARTDAIASATQTIK